MPNREVRCFSRLEKGQLGAQLLEGTTTTMTSETGSFPRGSEWRQWDLHIHSPASFHWEGEKFSPQRNQPRDIQIVDEMIVALNNATPAVFGLQDYWCFDGWFALKQRMATSGVGETAATVVDGILDRLLRNPPRPSSPLQAQ